MSSHGPWPGTVAGPPPLPGARTFPRCPGIPRSVEPPALFQSIHFSQKINHPTLLHGPDACLGGRTCPWFCTACSLCSPYLEASLGKRNLVGGEGGRPPHYDLSLNLNFTHQPSPAVAGSNALLLPFPDSNTAWGSSLSKPRKI